MDPLSIALAVTFVFFSAALRGFTGFGFAIAGVPLLTLVLPPQQAVPLVMMLMVVASLQTLARDWQDVDWPRMAWLLPGATLGVFPGVAILAAISPAAAQLIIGICVALAVLGLATGWKLKQAPGRGGIFGTGLAAGFCSGLAAMPGPPVITLYMALPVAPAVTRASLIFFFMVSGMLGASLAATKGLIGSSDLVLAALLTPPLILGTWLGSRAFHKSGGKGFRQIGLATLAAIAVIALANGAWALLA